MEQGRPLHILVHLCSHGGAPRPAHTLKSTSRHLSLQQGEFACRTLDAFSKAISSPPGSNVLPYASLPRKSMLINISQYGQHHHSPTHIRATGSPTGGAYPQANAQTYPMNHSPYFTSTFLDPNIASPRAPLQRTSYPSSPDYSHHTSPQYSGPSTPQYSLSSQPSPTLVQLGASRNYLMNSQPAPYIQVLDVDPEYHQSRDPSPNKPPRMYSRHTFISSSSCPISLPLHP